MSSLNISTSNLNIWRYVSLNCANLRTHFKDGCIFVIAESFEWALATFNFSNSSQRRVCRPQTRDRMYFSWWRLWACGWWWIRCILHHCGRRLHFLSCIREEKLPRNCKCQLQIFPLNFCYIFSFCILGCLSFCQKDRNCFSRHSQNAWKSRKC